MSDLPPFAHLWVQQWKEAAPRLQAIRDEELRRLERGSSASYEGPRLWEKNPHANGMVIMQRWLMRLELLRRTESLSQESLSREREITDPVNGHG